MVRIDCSGGPDKHSSEEVAIWVFTVDGFYSVVEFEQSLEEEGRGGKPGDLLVRARVQKDLEALKKYVPHLRVWRDDSADYRFRGLMSRAEWGDCLMGQVEEISYTNFKQRVAEKQGFDRSSVYARVWSVLLSLQLEDS